MSATQENLPRFCQVIDGLIRRIGENVAWLYFLLVINILVQVFLRYLLGEGKIWLEELQWHLYGVAIMFGIAYDITENAHIRLDLLYQKLAPIKKEYIDFFGYLFLVLPLITILFLHGLSFVETAWRVNEMSPHPLGLPWRWLIKSFIPISMLLIVMASLSRMVRSAYIIFTTHTPGGK